MSKPTSYYTSSSYIENLLYDCYREHRRANASYRRHHLLAFGRAVIAAYKLALVKDRAVNRRDRQVRQAPIQPVAELLPQDSSALTVSIQSPLGPALRNSLPRGSKHSNDE